MHALYKLGSAASTKAVSLFDAHTSNLPILRAVIEGNNPGEICRVIQFSASD
jgi:hypothetical protein